MAQRHRQRVVRAALLASIAWVCLPVAAHADAVPAPSSSVALVVGTTHSLPPVPTGSFQTGFYDFRQFAWSSLQVADLTTAALAPYDTLMLYGVNWSKLTADQHAAVDAFAQTGKVVIWDADAVLPDGGNGDYSDFIHPFETTASGAHASSDGAAVVASGAAGNPLASSDPTSPLYINMAELSGTRHAIGDMSVLNPLDASGDWTASLTGQHKSIEAGSWVVAWGYGVTSTHAGMTIYSGLDGDALCRSDGTTCSPGTATNWTRQELYLQLAAPFYRSAAPCAVTSSCTPPPPPPPPGGGGTGGDGSGGTSSGSPQAAVCALAAPVPRGWVHGTITVRISTTASGASALALQTPGGRTIASRALAGAGSAAIKVDTTRLLSNHRDGLIARVGNGQGIACSVAFALPVDNVKARVLGLTIHRVGRVHVVRFRPSEAVKARLLIRSKGTWHTLRAGIRATLRTSLQVATAKLVLVDRARNVTTRSLKLP
jgi:hypothetical protein